MEKSTDLTRAIDNYCEALGSSYPTELIDAGSISCFDG